MTASNPGIQFAYGRKCLEYPRFRAKNIPRTAISKKLPLLKLYQQRELIWLRGKDSNQRPPGYEPDELPAALPRDISLACI